MEFTDYARLPEGPWLIVLLAGVSLIGLALLAGMFVLNIGRGKWLTACYVAALIGSVGITAAGIQTGGPDRTVVQDHGTASGL